MTATELDQFLPASRSSCDTSAGAQSEAAAPAQLPACCPANLNVSPDAASPTAA
jgi:hypothetical protein